MNKIIVDQNKDCMHSHLASQFPLSQLQSLLCAKVARVGEGVMPKFLLTVQQPSLQLLEMSIHGVYTAAI